MKMCYFYWKIAKSPSARSSAPRPSPTLIEKSWLRHWVLL